ncbi:MAG: DUF445 domain-containing protein [Pseudolabrys sp.]|jgi:uncharacterized membrane-anchored protein YjiN (DUF445 family)
MTMASDKVSEEKTHDLMSSVALQYPPIPLLSSTDEIKVRRALRRNRLLATGLLLLMVGIAVAMHFVPSQGWPIQLARAGAEAGIVGGLADWFAITVLFRHPFGIPIPHTAILPRNKDRIGRALGAFVERNFLIPEVILPRLRQWDLTGKISNYLVSPENASTVAERIIALLKRLPTANDSSQSELIQRIVGQQLRKLDLAPLLARVIKVFTTSKESDVLFEKMAQTMEGWITTHKNQIDEMVAQHSRWWIPKTVDRRIASQVVDGAIDVLHRLRQRESDVRKQFQAAVAKITDDLMKSPEQSEKLQRLKNLLSDDPEVRAWIGSAWDGVSEQLMRDLSDPQSHMRSTLHSKIIELGHSIRDDASLRTLIDNLIEGFALLSIRYRGEIGSLIAEVIRSWDARTVSDRLELVLGSDLQYIRINGAIVGALVGCAIYLLSALGH